MRKKLFLTLTLLSFVFIQLSVAQTKEPKKHNPEAFDEEAAVAEAKAKGIKASELKGYIAFLKNDFSSKRALTQQKHLHTPYETSVTGDVQETVIYLSPNKTMSIGCPNMSFDQYNFTGWTGGIGTVGTGPVGGNPIYTSTGASIINPAGNNISVASTANYHTIMSVPATNNVYPNCVSFGYDSLACRAVGTQTLSDIPFVSPFSFDPVSVRMNSSNANYRACRLKYITTSSSTNQRLSFSYAVVLQNPSGHLVNESPYFKVSVVNEGTGVTLPGCTSYTFNPKSTVPSDSMKTSVVGSTFDPTFYRKWQYYSVDLSSLPAGTNVSINFEVGGCTQSGHWGYAYVDAECGGLGTPYANMCSGSSFATLVAPTGFTTYQWTGPSGIIPAGSGGTNDTLVVPGAVVGNTYTVSMVSPGGCAITQTVSIVLTTVSIVNLNSTSSCLGGASGTAFVQAIGSNGIYTYTWTNTTTGAIVSNSQTATGLPPGTYSVVVASTTCGQASANLSVGVSPALYFSQTKQFCGNSTSIAVPGATNCQWYQGLVPVLIPAPNGTNDTLQIAAAVAGSVYTLVYTTPGGCKDSIKYTLAQVTGGSTYVNNIQNVCPGATNGSAVLNLSTPFSAPYIYNVTGPTAGTIVSNTTMSATTLSMTPLAAGTYSYMINDGTCIYNSTFTISPIQTNFSVTATNTVLCFPTDTARLFLNFGSGIPSTCALSTTGGCSTPNSIQLGTGTAVNSTTGYPAIYGNFYRNTRHQILYTAAELLAAGVLPGKLSSISWNITTISGTTAYPDFTIKMKCTNTTNLSSLTFETGLTQVYYAATANITAGWNTYTFPTPYEWDGVSNILIDVCNSQTSSYTTNSQSPFTVTPFVSVRYFNSDGTVACPITTGFGSSSDRPNLKFENCGSVNASTYTVSVSSNGTITANFNNDSIKVVPTFVSPPAGNVPTIYTVSVVNPNGGCVATRTIAILYPSPITTVTAVPMTTTICEGSQVTLSASGAVLYNWYYQQGASSVSIATTPSITVTPPSVGINTYSVTGKSPCPSSIPDTKILLVTVMPKADLLISPLQDVTKCMNKNFNISTGVGSATPGNPGTPYTYSWTTLPTNAAAPGVNNTSTYNVTSNSTTTLVVTVGGVCAKPNSDTIVVKNFADNMNVSLLDTSTTCAGTQFTLRSLAVNGYPNYNYNWYIVPSTTPISSSANLTSLSPETEGTYTITLFVNDSCGYARSVSEIITVLPPCSVIIPNVITPNGDGINDFFKIKNIEHNPNTVVTIFDRWGLKVYENPNYNNEWNPTHVADGTFFYVVDVPNDKKYSGFITIFHNK